MLNPFENISLKNRDKLIKILHGYTINYHKNQRIVDFLKDEDDIGIIISGYIRIIKNNYNGTTTNIEELYENNVIGASLLYSDSEYEIIAKEDTKIILLSYSDIINQDINDKSYNQFIKNLFIIMRKKIDEKNERIEILTNKTIRNKLLSYFNITSKKNGSRFIYLPFNFSDLANYLAIDRSAMSREIGYLKEEGIIEIKGKKITLLYR